MILGIWKNIKIYCDNHEEPVLFKEKQGETMFYACPKYYPESEDFPQGYLEGEKKCLNRLSFHDAQKIVEEFSSIMEDSLISGEMFDFTNYKFRHRMYDVRIIYYSLSDMVIKIGVINRSALSVGL